MGNKLETKNESHREEVVTRRLMIFLLSFLLTGGLLLGNVTGAYADGSGNADVAENGCMEDVAGFGLNCTANDIQIASVTNLEILDDGCAFPGDTVTFQADFEVLLTAQARHDIGLWFATDGDPNGDGAYTGDCTVATPAYGADPPYLDLDGQGDTFLDTNVVSNIQDTCGDIDATHNPQYPTVEITAVCIDTDGDGQLNLPNCTSWKQPGDNDLCTNPLPVADVGGPGLDSSGVPPGSPAKCRCDIGFQIPINVPGQIIVDKVTYVNGSPLPGDPTSFDFELTGEGSYLEEDPVAIDPVDFDLTDADMPFGSTSLNKGTYQITETVPADWALTSVSCTSDNATPNDTGDDVTFPYTNGADITLTAGEIITCTFNDTFLADPVIDIQKSGTWNNTGNPMYVEAGETVDYDLLVTNTGNVPLSSVSVTDPMLTSVSCPKSILAVGESMTCSATYTITQADIDNNFTLEPNNVSGGQLDNTATASGTDEYGTTVDDTDDEVVPFPPQSISPLLSITKDATEQSYDEVGDVINYTIVATNIGNVTLNDVTVTDPLVTGLTCDPTNGSTLAPGATMTCTATHTVTQADLDAGHWANTACVDDSGDAAEVCDDEDVPGDQNPALSITKDATEQSYDEVGDVINYTIVATNIGNVTLNDVTVTDPLVTGLTCDPTNGSTLAPGATMTCTATHTVTQADLDAGHWANTACVDDSGDAAEVCDDEDVPGDQNPALSITKDATEQSYDEVGDVINYTIVATNIGNVTLNDVTVTDPLVTGLTCDPTNGSTLAPGATMTCTATHTVTQADLDAGHWANTACVDDSGDAAEVCDDEDVPGDQNPALSITKDATEQSYDEVGDVINYTIVATNIGNVTLNDVTVTDPLVTGLTCDPTNGSTLAPGATMTCTATHTVTQADLDAGHWANTACVDDSGDAAEVCDDEDVPGDQNPAIDIEKATNGNDADAAPGPSILIGNAVTWTYVATNTGNVTLSAISVDDDQGATVSCSTDTLAPGETMTCSASGTASAGQYANIGTATGTSPDGQPVTDSDPSHYFGADPDYTVSKSCESQPVPQDGSADFDITLANTGNVDLTITTDEIGDVTLMAFESSSSVVVVDGPFSGQAAVENTIETSATYTDDVGNTWSDSQSDYSSCEVGGWVNLLKLTQGSENSSMEWTFNLYEGPDGFDTTPLASDSTPPALLDFGNENLDPAGTYTICEISVPAGWAVYWEIDTDGDGITDTALIPYNPNADDDVPSDLGNRCFDFGVGTDYPVLPGETLQFLVDNTFPGGEPRTPGYWKNWNTCTNGGQVNTAAKNGGPDAGWFILDDILNSPGIIWDDIQDDMFVFQIETCEDGVSILDQRSLDRGKKMASDAAYTLAMHLMAAQLNFAAGAESCEAAQAAALAGETLLDELDFDGTGSYLRPKKNDTTYQDALNLAYTLDEYNNGYLCTP